MLSGGFNLRKWNSNNPVLLKEVNRIESEGLQVNETSEVSEDDETYSKYANGTSHTEGQFKVLGVNWDKKADTLHAELSVAKLFAKTKRSVLKIAAKLFDPKGYLTLLTINFKALFQQLCIKKNNWDEELVGEDRKIFVSLVMALENHPNILSVLCYPFLIGEKVLRIELHGFSDSSEMAFATSVYLRVEFESGKIDSKLIASKLKVTPIKKQTIPRLELLGACLMVKLVENIYDIMQQEIKGQSIHKFYWVDSMAVFCWVKNPKPWAQCVRNWVDEILQKSNRGEWFYCPGPLNPAYLPSRGKYQNIDVNPLWWEGPGFLKSRPQ